MTQPDGADFVTNSIVQDHYQLERLLSRRGPLSTWLAQDLNGGQVVVKLLRLRALDTWKQLERFEREVTVLKQLHAEGLPRCLDRFYSSDRLTLGLVTEYVPAQTLEAHLNSGWKPDIHQTLALAEQLLEILAYLHNHHPPVIHRDLKPSNILLDDLQRPYLIDFGSVQQLLEPDGASTVVGTYGYMPPEQFAGQCRPASDLYALGATLIHVLSGTSPAEMVYSGLKLRFEPYLSGPVALRDWLAKLTAPVEERYSSARAALRGLEELKTRLVKEQRLMSQPVSFKRLEMQRNEDGFSCGEPRRFTPEMYWLILSSLGFFNLGAITILLKLMTVGQPLMMGGLITLTALQGVLLPQFRHRRLRVTAEHLEMQRDWFWHRRIQQLNLAQVQEVIARPTIGGWRVEVMSPERKLLCAGLNRSEAEGLKQVLLQQVLIQHD